MRLLLFHEMELERKIKTNVMRELKRTRTDFLLTFAAVICESSVLISFIIAEDLIPQIKF